MVSGRVTRCPPRNHRSSLSVKQNHRVLTPFPSLRLDFIFAKEHPGGANKRVNKFHPDNRRFFARASRHLTILLFREMHEIWILSLSAVSSCQSDCKIPNSYPLSGPQLPNKKSVSCFQWFCCICSCEETVFFSCTVRPKHFAILQIRFCIR